MSRWRRICCWRCRRVKRGGAAPRCGGREPLGGAARGGSNENGSRSLSPPPPVPLAACGGTGTSRPAGGVGDGVVAPGGIGDCSPPAGDVGDGAVAPDGMGGCSPPAGGVGDGAVAPDGMGGCSPPAGGIGGCSPPAALDAGSRAAGGGGTNSNGGKSSSSGPPDDPELDRSASRSRERRHDKRPRRSDRREAGNSGVPLSSSMGRLSTQVARPLGVGAVASQELVRAHYHRLATGAQQGGRRGLGRPHAWAVAGGTNTRAAISLSSWNSPPGASCVSLSF